MENSIVRCKVCGRRLTNPLSIARGMGPRCAGVSSSNSARLLPLKRSVARSYSDVASRQFSLPLSFATAEALWECDCKENNTHLASEPLCPLCGARREGHAKPRAKAAIKAG